MYSKKTELLEKVRKTIEDYKMVSPGDRIVVGFSGGADSMTLLYVLNELKKEMNLQLVAAHINHGLRTLIITRLRRLSPRPEWRRATTF